MELPFKIIQKLLPKTLSSTERFFKFIKDEPIYNRRKNKFDSRQKQQLRLLEDNGVDISGIHPQHIDKALKKRGELLKTNTPKKYVIQSPSTVFEKYSNLIGIKGGKVVGEMDLFHYPNNGYTRIGFVRNLSNGKEKGVQEFMTNSAIKINRQLNGTGVISGETLLQPEKTSKMYPRYKSKKLFGNYGEWGTIQNNPVYLLQKETYDVPTKSILFNPSILNNSGKMKINWKDSNIFKSLIPLFVINNVSWRNP